VESFAITGLGAVSALGDGVPALATALAEGRDGITEMARFDLSPLHPIRLAGWLRARWERGERASAEAWAVEAAREAWADAGAPAIAPERVAVVLGSTEADQKELPAAARAVREALGARGPSFAISTACSSSADAIAAALELLDAGDADVVVAGGVEALLDAMFAGFAALGVLSAEKCAPFGEDAGTTLGEGAGFLVIERQGARPGQRVRASLLGAGLSSDAYHETSPDPRGEGIARAMTACLADAGVAPGEVGYVNAHATGTAANDGAEWRGVQRALGARAGAIPVSGSKGFFGHAQGAAGVLEAIATIVCMEQGLVPPSLRVGAGRKDGPPDPVAGERPRAAEVDVALSTNAAFGGANVVLALGRGPRVRRERAPRDVFVRALAWVGTNEGHPRDEGAWADALGELDLRASDPAGRMVTAASVRALRAAGLRVRGALRDRAGISGGLRRPSPASAMELGASLERGLARASAPAFARIVAHAPFALASRILALRGPFSAVVTDESAGLLALARGARWVSDGRAEVLVAAAFEERAPDTTHAEGAAAAALATESAAGALRVAGIAIEGPGRVVEASARALARAGLDVDAVVRVEASTAADRSLGALAAALEIAPASALLSCDGPDLSLALVLVPHAPGEPT
jgi:3-oxoacyl-[acyl-carrier-protein] synthase II